MKTLYTPENAPLFNKLYKQIIDKKIIQLWFGSKTDLKNLEVYVSILYNHKNLAFSVIFLPYISTILILLIWMWL